MVVGEGVLVEGVIIMVEVGWDIIGVGVVV